MMEVDEAAYGFSLGLQADRFMDMERGKFDSIKREGC
jgi:hypothetical protein